MSAQLTLQIQESKHDQSSRLLRLLESREVVELPAIMALHIASHTRRISDLRKRGYDIRCDTVWIDGVRHSSYRPMRPLAKDDYGYGAEADA